MTITDNSRTTAPRPVSSLTRALSQVSLEEQARPAKKAALSIASETLKAQQTRQIVSYCNAIDREIPLIQVNTRRALSTYLVNNQIHDTGLLNQRQKTCALGPCWNTQPEAIVTSRRFTRHWLAVTSVPQKSRVSRHWPDR